MTNTTKYSFQELLSFFSQCEPPPCFQDSCPVFSPDYQPPLDFSNYKPNLHFGKHAFNFAPKRQNSGDVADNSNSNHQNYGNNNSNNIHENKKENHKMTEWKPQKGSKTISFKPQNLTESTIENSSSNDAIQEAPKNSQVKTFNPKPKEYKEEVEENIETAEETKSSHEDPYLKFKQNIPKKLIEPPKKKEKVVLDHPPPPKENPFIKKTKSGFAPKKAAQVYEAPDVQLNGHQNDNDNNNENQSKKPSFLDLQNEEKNDFF